MPDQEQPIMMLLAGPNGAGKTTFRKKFLESNATFSEFISLNWDDETAKKKEEQPDLTETEARIITGKDIIKRTKQSFEQRKNFVYETVAADFRHLRLMKTARAAGYKVVTIFIGLSSPELSKLRVKHRVQNGGHNVAIEDIESRYPKIIANLPSLMEESDTCFVIDNSGKNYKLILLKSNDLNMTFSKFPNYLPLDKFDLTKELQEDGSMLLPTSKYTKKSAEEKQELIRHLLEFFSVKDI